MKLKNWGACIIFQKATRWVKSNALVRAQRPKPPEVPEFW